MRQQLLQHVTELDAEDLPAYVYDLHDLREHAAAIHAALPEGVQLFYAAKANSDPRLLEVLRDHVDGFEVASGGELHHIQATCPGAPIAFGGPGKTPAELEQALQAGVDRLHIESEQELHLLTGMPGERTVAVLLRVNLPIALGPVALAMGGRPSPFGLDPAHLDRCLALIADDPRIRLRGIHVHLASGLDATAQLDLAGRVLTWASEWADQKGVELSEVNLGGGMGVDYGCPDRRFDWAAFGAGLHRLLEGHPQLTLRIEPGRSVTVYCGWYVTEVLDIKRSAGRAFAVLRGGTHHLRTPAAKQHDQPFAIIPVDTWDRPWKRPRAQDEPVTLVGQLCTPKDVLARGVQAERLRVGDKIAFGLAGAYAWNISHHAFLMHPAPRFHHLDHAPVPAGPQS
ncbi:diaminopimelate decarboxylase [Streptomyces griseochromogenes]|uniref:Decarboxylase n=1 Tax=Streptomyces griseochromogenes TaxID=68214 RepID=A0A1B1B3N5_9ACTN|nr:type III PLP-dependent enzyme [Streptomyces griseochromogenes]ANP53413.1 decarboxylase [Streptomyces griseochromogenes]MBP2055109.1 diaminopimelate decarboxylase [Streptomyces griseochromogenes]